MKRNGPDDSWDVLVGTRDVAGVVPVGDYITLADQSAAGSRQRINLKVTPRHPRVRVVPRVRISLRYWPVTFVASCTWSPFSRGIFALPVSRSDVSICAPTAISATRTARMMKETTGTMETTRTTTTTGCSAMTGFLFLRLPLWSRESPSVLLLSSLQFTVTRTHTLLNRSSGTESDDDVRLFHGAAHYSSARESRGPHVRFERSTRPAARPAIGPPRRLAIGPPRCARDDAFSCARLIRSLLLLLLLFLLIGAACVPPLIKSLETILIAISPGLQ